MVKRIGKGKKFGDWQLKELLGEGANGFVWLALNSSGETAALKILAKLDRKSRSKAYARFKHEVKVVQANSDIAGILPILDSYLPDEMGENLPWYVMPVAEPLESYEAIGTFESSIAVILSVGRLLCKGTECSSK